MSTNIVNTHMFVFYPSLTVQSIMSITKCLKWIWTTQSAYWDVGMFWLLLKHSTCQLRQCPSASEHDDLGTPAMPGLHIKCSFMFSCFTGTRYAVEEERHYLLVDTTNVWLLLLCTCCRSPGSAKVSSRGAHSSVNFTTPLLQELHLDDCCFKWY